MGQVYLSMFSRNKAIIIGGGIAGKLAVRVLSDFFKEVVIIEQDQEPEKAVFQEKVFGKVNIYMLSFMQGNTD